MSTDPRELLQRGQTSLLRGAPREANQAFKAAANLFASPADLLGAGHAWRGQAQVGIQMGAFNQARSALERAATLYAAGQFLLEGVADEAFVPIRVELREGIATTKVMDADALLQLGRFREARSRIDEAYPIYQELGDRPSVSDLWTVTARLSEREGRWFSARTAWTQVLRTRRSNHDEAGQCDALIRLAEAILAEGEEDQATEKLDVAETIARELEDRTLRGRVNIARARVHEMTHDWNSAWEKWQDAVMDLQGAEATLRGLAMVRMARTAAKVQPLDTGKLLEDGLDALLDGEYPDAVGLVLHQLAVVALMKGNRDRGVLASIAAERARGGWDPSLHGLVFRSLLGIGARTAARLLCHRRHETKLPNNLVEDAELPDGLDLDDEEAVDAAYWAAIEEILEPRLSKVGLTFDQLGSRGMALRLAGGATAATSPVPRLAGSLELVWQLREGELLHHALDGAQLIGRGGSNAIRMTWDGLASRSHCVVEQRHDGIWVRDLDSQHGTFLDDIRLVAEQRLEAGQRLRVGETEFRIEPTQAAAAQVAIPVAE